MDSKPWVDGLSFSRALDSIVNRYGDNDAVVFPQLDLRWSYREFQERIKQVGRALLAIGVKPGEHVGIWATNWPEWLLTHYGASHIGAVCVNVNPAYRVHELEFMLRQAQIKALVLTDTFKHSNYETMITELVPDLATRPFDDLPILDNFPHLRHVISIKNTTSTPGIWPWNEFLAQSHQVSVAAVDEISDAVTCSMPANIQYTSGTTGAPKGAMLSHRNLLMNAWFIGERMHFTDKDRLCIPVPFYHCFGCVLATMNCIVHGATMVIPAESFSPDLTLEAVEKEHCTALHGVPTMFNAEIHLPGFEEYDLSTLRTGIMAGSPCPVELMKQVTTRMHLSELTIAYGLTEFSPVITQSETTDPLHVRVSSVGRPLPEVEVRIVNHETLQDVEDGQPGELWARGHGVMLGYYNDPAATRAVITEDGWLRTGDLAQRTEDGYYRITGRIKDMIIRGGENIYPCEIEEFLRTHPHVYDAYVVGLPDPHYGEQVSAWIIRKDQSLTEDEIKKYCQGEIAHYKIPYYVQFVNEFPMTVSSKIQKFKLREMGVEVYGLQAASQEKTA